MARSGVLWFFAHLSPTNSVVERYDLINDRQLDLALVGPALIVAVSLAQLRFAIVRTALAAALAIDPAYYKARINLDALDAR